MAANHRKPYEHVEPPVEWSEEDGCSILTIHLPGFSKEQIRVQVSSTRKLRISGERPYRNNVWQRFHKEFQIPANCDTSKITAKYKGGILHVRQPLQEKSKPHTAAPTAQPPKQQSVTRKQPADSETYSGKQQAAAAEKKSSVTGDGKVEAKSGEESKETANASRDNVGKAGKDTPERASGAGRLKEVIPRNLVKLILPILLAVLLFLYAKRLSPTIFVGVGEPPQ